jgi:hypothetical protein
MVGLRRRWSEILAQLETVTGSPLSPASPLTAAPLASPWFVRALLGVGAWVSALFVLGSIGALVGGREGILGMGALVLAGGVVLLRLQRGEFLRQLGLSFSLAGQLGVAIGLGEVFRQGSVLAAIGLAVELILVPLVAYPVHRFCSTVLAATAATALLVCLKVPAACDLSVLAIAVAVGAFWISHPRRLRAAGTDAWTPAGYGLVLALFGLLVFCLMSAAGVERILEDRMTTGRLASSGIGLGVVALALAVSREAGVPRPAPLHAVALAALALIGFATPSTPGIAAAVGVLLLGLHRRTPALVGLAVVFLIGFLTLLYYSMAASLLAKALHLMTAGAVLLVAAWWLHRQEDR